MATPPKTDSGTSLKQNLANQKWLTLIGLPVLLVATFNSIYSLWGLLFIYWGATAIMARETYLLQPIRRDDDPAIFWIICALWVGSGVLYIMTDFFPEYIY